MLEDGFPAQGCMDGSKKAGVNANENVHFQEHEESFKTLGAHTDLGLLLSPAHSSLYVNVSWSQAWIFIPVLIALSLVIFPETLSGMK